MAAPSQEEYFAEDFDPSGLKVPQLRSILVEHNIPVPGTAKKADLISLFESHVRPKAQKLLNKARTVKASAKGIIAVSENGSEAPVEPPKRGRGRPRKTAPVEDAAVERAPKRSRQSSRLSKTPAPSEGRTSLGGKPDVPPVPLISDIWPMDPPRPRQTEGDGIPPEPVPRPRGRPRKEKPVVSEPVEEDGAVAEIEDEAEKVEVKKSRARPPASAPISPEAATSTAPSSSRMTMPSSNATELLTPQEEKPKGILQKRTPVVHVPGISEEDEDLARPRATPSKRKLKARRRSDGEESGFSDVNPFQSGSEEAAKEELRRRRKTMGATRDGSDKPKTPRRSEPAPFSFTPGGQLRRVGPSKEQLKTPPSAVREKLIQEKELDAAERYNQAVQEKLSRITSGQNETPPEITITEEHNGRRPSISSSALTQRATEAVQHIPAPKRSLPLAVLSVIFLIWLANWKSASSSIGFCDTNRNTNDIVLTRESQISEAQACQRVFAEQKLSDTPPDALVKCDVKYLPLVPSAPRPTACTPCPLHATCLDGELVSCENEYIISHSPLAILGPLVDGLPGLGPKVFPPTCKPDTAKKRLVGGLAKEMESYLARGRGRVECARLGRDDGRRGEGERFGVTESTLKDVFETRRDPKFSKEQFDEVFEAALKDLVDHEDVIESIDVNAISWFAAKRSEMSLSCSAKTQVYKSVDEWKAQLASTAAIIAAILALQTRFKHRRAEKYRADELVEVVLRRLQDQERLHYTDPSSNPHSYLAPAQVRDVVLPPKGSVASRSRTWKRVEEIVEKNANVAVREREVGGELWSTWEWTGPVAALREPEMEVPPYQGTPGRVKF